MTPSRAWRSSSRAGSGAIGSDRANPEHPETLATRCSSWRVIVSTRSNALYHRCATEHGRPRQPSRNGKRAGQAGRAGSQRAVDPPTLLLTSDDPSRLSPRTSDKRFRWSEAIWWAWEDLNLRLHPYQRSAHGPVSAGSRLPPARTTYRWRPLETVANRSGPMACGPNVDQALVRSSTCLLARREGPRRVVLRGVLPPERQH
jgi:hypothetical protein